MSIHRLSYVSTAVPNLKTSDIDAIVDVAQRGNAEAAITGLLLFNGINFLQTLEGKEDRVKSLVERIKSDPRHSGVIVLGDGPCESRAFSGWSMGYAGLNASCMRPSGADGNRLEGNGFDPSKMPNALPRELLLLYTSFDSLG